MISIACLTGPHAGQTRIPSPEMDPAGLFTSLVRHGWAWEVNYYTATVEETLRWFRAEIGARIMRALNAGRPVIFDDRFYLILSDDPNVVAQKLEDDIVSSGRMVTIDSDDEQGLAIGVRGYEK